MDNCYCVYENSYVWHGDWFEKDKEITIIGTISKYVGATKKNSRQVYIKNCIAQQ